MAEHAEQKKDAGPTIVEDSARPQSPQRLPRGGMRALRHVVFSIPIWFSNVIISLT